MTSHIVTAFDTELDQLKKMIAEMGGLAEEQLGLALDAITRRDIDLADRVIDMDQKIDALEHTLEERAIVLIAKRQPMATDLRHVMVAIRIASDLERIGDLAKNIAKRTHAMTDMAPRRVMTGLKRMGTLALEQLKRVLDAYERLDETAALDVWRTDEDIDSLYNSIFRELLTYMMEDARTIGLCTHLLFGAKNLERIGDHATNIAENIYYEKIGKTIPDERPKKDKTPFTPISTPAQ